MKVLIIHSSAELYGSDRCLLWIAEGLIGKGHQVDVVLPFDGVLKGELESVGAGVYLIDPVVFRRSVMNPRSFVAFSGKAWFRILRLRSLISRNGYDLVHSNTGVVIGGGVAARLCKVPHLWHFREMLTEFGTLWKFYEPLVAGTSTQIVCISDAVAGQFRSGRARAKSSVVHDGIPVAASPPVDGKRAPGPVRLLSVARLASYKSQDLLVTATDMLLKDGLEVTLTLVGDVFGSDTTYRDSLKRQIRDLGLEERVRLAGFQSDVTPYLDEADIFVHPSRRPEGLGLVVLEAMARGKPVVATSGGGTAEIITDGVNGVLVEPGSAQALVAGIRRIVDDPGKAQSLRERAYATVAGSFSVPQMMDKLEHVYEKMLRP